MAASIQVIGGPWSEEEIERHLLASILPIRLASIAPDGWPVVQSLWYVYEAGALWCATQPNAHIVARLEREPHCGFEVAADTIPYRGVRGRAVATIDRQRGPQLLPQLLRRYLGGTDSRLAKRLMARAEHEVAIRLGELRVTTWDFTARMTD